MKSGVNTRLLTPHSYFWRFFKKQSTYESFSHRFSSYLCAIFRNDVQVSAKPCEIKIKKFLEENYVTDYQHTYGI